MSNFLVSTLCPIAKLPGADTSGSRDAESIQFSDAQEQARVLTGWNQEYLQLSAGVFHGAFRQIGGVGIRLFVEEVQQSVFQVGVLSSDILAVGLTLDTDGTGMFCGAGCGADSLHVFSGSEGFEFRTPRNHTMLGVELLVGNHSLSQLSISQDPRRTPDLSGRAGTVVLESKSFTAIKSHLLTFTQAAISNPSLLDKPSVVSTLSDFLLYHMSLVDPRGKEARSSLKHRVLVQGACALVNENRDQMPTVAQLCLELNVSRRTLQVAFQQLLNVSPLMYVRAVRMNRARRLLKHANSVTDAATACGFWHFGHFSHDYQAMFGERPSDTLRDRARK